MENQKRQEQEEALVGVESGIVCELSLNMQLFRMIMEAGPQGVSTKELFGRLRLNAKRNMHRMKTLQSVYGIEMHAENCGRSNLNRCFAPLAAIQKQLKKTTKETAAILPTIQPPVGGWMMAVKRAAMVALDFEEDGSHWISKHDQESSTVYPDTDDEAQRRMHAYLFSHLVSSRSTFRAKHLLEKVETDDFVLRSHLGAYFRDLEVAHGLASAGSKPDRKTIDRVVSKLLNEQKIKKVKVSIMSKQGGASRWVDVLMRKDLEISDDILRRIRDSKDVFCSTAIHRFHMVSQSVSQQHSGAVDLPVLSNVTRLPRLNIAETEDEAKQGTQASNFQQIHINGFVNAKMTRARLLHDHICRLVGLGGYSKPKEIASESEQGFPKLLQKPVDVHSLKDVAETSKTYIFASVAERNKTPQDRPCLTTIDPEFVHRSNYTFTPRQLWDSFPTDLYLKVVGTSKRSDKISEIRQTAMRMMDLPEEKQELLVDRLSKNRLADLLNLLCRMQLIESGVVANANEPGRMEPFLYIVHDTGEAQMIK